MKEWAGSGKPAHQVMQNVELGHLRCLSGFGAPGEADSYRENCLSPVLEIWPRGAGGLSFQSRFAARDVRQR